MTRTLTVFDLGRMRQLDLLAVWHRLHPDSSGSHEIDRIARMSKEWLVTTILARPA